MQVLKFGGTSLADAERIANVARLIHNRRQQSRLGIVVSAISGVTNFLDQSMTHVLKGAEISELVQTLEKKHYAIIDNLSIRFSSIDVHALKSEVANYSKIFQDYLTGIQLLKECPPSIHTAVIVLGERLSVKIMEAILNALGLSILMLKSEDCIKTTEDAINARPIFDVTYSRFEQHIQSTHDILLMPGFIASSLEGHLTTLGRNGSDYSAALMAVGLRADLFEIWTDVDGIYSADPNIVKDAVLLPEMSYEEAMELSFFGAKVLHPKTIAPIAAHHIPTKIKNSLNLDAPGTFIHFKADYVSQFLVRGISHLEKVAMLSVSGAGMKGIPGIATRIFGAISRKEISLILITQSSSEYTIGFCVASADAASAKEALETELHLELEAHLIDSIECQEDLAVVSVVGDGMKTKRGVAGKFFSSLASVDVNVIAISQGAAERSISTVVEKSDALRSVLIAHQFFFNTRQEINIFLVGVGTVGSQLLRQIHSQQKDLARQNIEVKVCGIANSKKMILNKEGISLNNWTESLSRVETPSSIPAIINYQFKERLLNAIFVDCTSSEEVSLSYDRVFEAGMHVATPNKKANTDSEDYYQTLRQKANDRGRKFLYETNVGAGLPVIDTLQNLIKSGDQLIEFEGILSGSLSYVFGLLDEDVSFSQAVIQAREQGFTEPDPRDDLSGMDVARKLLILYRESGYHAEINDVIIEPILPDHLNDPSMSIDDFLQALPAYDQEIETKVLAAKAEDQLLRLVGEIRNGVCKVGVIAVDKSHPLYPIKGGENALSFTTQRYAPIPLVIRGYGAGADVTAAGVFADILRVASWNPTYQ
ncbi:MAG: bifunctional aspartate kinase/homoserine dehydrogenase I [Pseudomonadota bacterium]